MPLLRAARRAAVVCVYLIAGLVDVVVPQGTGDVLTEAQTILGE